MTTLPEMSTQQLINGLNTYANSIDGHGRKASMVASVLWTIAGALELDMLDMVVSVNSVVATVVADRMQKGEE